MEFLQMALPYRSFNVNDLMANGVGVVIGMALWFMFIRKYVISTNTLK
ncbi:MAG: VanZ family protein [Bacteroidales bacterium]|nr:VanZ family protein [Bacteroidales bacterium]